MELRKRKPWLRHGIRRRPWSWNRREISEAGSPKRRRKAGRNQLSRPSWRRNMPQWTIWDMRDMWDMWASTRSFAEFSELSRAATEVGFACWLCRENQGCKRCCKAEKNRRGRWKWDFVNCPWHCLPLMTLGRRLWFSAHSGLMHRAAMMNWLRTHTHIHNYSYSPPVVGLGHSNFVTKTTRETHYPHLPWTCNILQVDLCPRKKDVSCDSAVKVGLVVANGLEEVERYLLYSCEGLIDGKQLIGEVFIKKNQSLEEAKEMLRDLLLRLVWEPDHKRSHTFFFITARLDIFACQVRFRNCRLDNVFDGFLDWLRSSMETHGVGVSLHIRMGDSACDLQRFCGDGMFPAEVFGGPQRWSNEEARFMKRFVKLSTKQLEIWQNLAPLSPLSKPCGVEPPVEARSVQ